MNGCTGVACVCHMVPVQPIASASGTGQPAPSGGGMQSVLVPSKSAPTASHLDEDSHDTPYSSPCGAP